MSEERFGGKFDPTPLCNKSPYPRGFRGKSEKLCKNEMQACYGGKNKRNAEAFVKRIIRGKTKNCAELTLKDKKLSVVFSNEDDQAIFDESNVRYVVENILGWTITKAC